MHRFLVLENAAGDREILIPKQTYTELKKTESYPSTCERFKLENNRPISRSPGKNAYLAYVMLAYAHTRQEYVLAMEYLKQAFSFERYSSEDLRVLGWLRAPEK